MSAPVPIGLPARLRAGETLNFRVTLADYSAADGYDITWNFRSTDGNKVDFTSAASGIEHLVNVPATDTVAWAAARYHGAAMVSNGTFTRQVWSGNLVILPNLAAEEGGFDDRSQARRTLDNINAVLEKRANSTILNSTIEGTMFGRIPMDQLLMLKNRYETIVAQEQGAEDMANGLGNRKNVFVRFTTPR